MKNLSPELLQKYAEIILAAQSKGYAINEENLRKIAKEIGKESVLREIEEELRIKTDTKETKNEYKSSFLQKTKKTEKIVLPSATAITIKIFIAVGILVFGIFACVWYFSAIVSVPKRNSIVFYDAFTSPQGSKIWLIYADYGENTVINLVDGQNKKLLKEIKSTISRPKTEVLDNKIYLFDDKSRFEARDSHTGNIVLNDELLAKQFPQLKNGIGTTKYNTGWLDIVTKQGELFYYHLKTNKLCNETEKKNFVEKYDKQAFTKFSWGISSNSTEIKNIMLTSKNANFYRENPYTQKNTHTINQSDWEKLKNNGKMYDEEKLVFSPEKTFLGGEIIFGDSLYCVVRHQTEIGDNAKPIFSCIGVKEKKILWEIQNIDPKQSALLTYLDKTYIGSLSCSRYNNLLSISTQTCKIEGKGWRFYPVSCQIDIQTGKILWECAPTY